MEAIELSKKIALKDAGNVRSLAVSVAGILSNENHTDPVKTAWTFAKHVAEKDKKFTEEFAKNEFVVFFASPVTVTPTTVSVSASTPKSAEPSKNQRIKDMLSEGKTVSEIAKLLGLTYQRVKNIKKSLK